MSITILDENDKNELLNKIAQCVESVNGQIYNPVAKTEDMTQPVGADENGRLWVAPEDGTGMTTAQITAMDNMFKVCAFTKPDVSAEYNAFKTAFGIGGEVEPDAPDVPDEPDAPEKTLTSISAVYSGGDVAVGTSVSELTGIVVTAHYSDGASETVTGYTLSGTIAEGSNTINVSYGGKTTTFTVTGTAESGGGETVYPASEICTEIGFLKLDGVSVNTANSLHSDYIAVGRFKEASVYFRTTSINNGFSAFWFYDENKTPIIGTNGFIGEANGICSFVELSEAEVPETAAYIVINVDKNATLLAKSTITLYS